MKVKLLKTGRTQEVNDSYGARLIEQGRAVVVPEANQPEAGSNSPLSHTAVPRDSSPKGGAKLEDAPKEKPQKKG